jgi:zinc protease
VLTALRQDDDNPAIQAERHLRRLLYGARHPYGRPVRGAFESVDRLDSSALRRFHARFVHPSVTSLVIVGEIEPDAAIAAAERLSSVWQTRTQPVTAALTVPAPPHTRQQVIVPMMGKSQTDIAYGFIGLRRHDPLYYAAWVMNTALGQYGLGGRLGDNIREQQGMAYYAFSDLEADVLPGPFVVRAGVNAANVQRTIDAIDLEIRRIVQDGLDDAELTETKRFLVASMPRLLETNAGIASFFQDVELYGLGEEYDRRLPDLVAGVTQEGVAEAARVLLDPSRATIVIAGPYQPA